MRACVCVLLCLFGVWRLAGVSVGVKNLMCMDACKSTGGPLGWASPHPDVLILLNSFLQNAMNEINSSKRLKFAVAERAEGTSGKKPVIVFDGGNISPVLSPQSLHPTHLPPYLPPTLLLEY